MKEAVMKKPIDNRNENLIVIGIMQPYFLPYLDYWRLIYMSDKFVIYDNIKFTKNSWIRRNRLFVSGKQLDFSLPLRAASDSLNINERYLSNEYSTFKERFRRWIDAEYSGAPYYSQVSLLIDGILDYKSINLFDFLFNSIRLILSYLDIDTEIIVSSSLQQEKFLTGQDRVIDIVKILGGNAYINPISGFELYRYDVFKNANIDLRFLQKKVYYYNHKSYLISDFSIIDLIMYESIEDIHEFLRSNIGYE